MDHFRLDRRRRRSLGKESKSTKTTVRGFLVETDRPGFRADDVHGKWSLRASVTSALSLHDVHVPAENLLPEDRWTEVVR